MCTGTVALNKINEVKPNSISTTSIGIDSTTKRLKANELRTYINRLVNDGKIPGKQTGVDTKQADAAFYNDIKEEYCYYEMRYIAALKHFITLISTSGADVASSLQSTITLNLRLNTLLEIINYVGNMRGNNVNDRTADISKANSSLQEKLNILREQKEFLQNKDVRTRTQEEMLRYSAEKSRAMNIQIVFFVALNIVALGTIITVYKALKPSASIN